ncbi:hypothetical protein A9Q87_02105 [Flavobacteriales bacterium 34_180_T64]|nr:hypothetical protein A9Q87_02105 [Flavobacteriales bacterium 34_180_T64]
MGFGGVGSMNVVLNNNKLLLNKNNRFKKTLGGYDNKDSNQRYVMPEIRPHTLRRIRLKIQKENRRVFIKRFVLMSLFIVLLVVVFLRYT